MSEESKKLIIVCSYCNRCYGKYINGERICFPPITIATDPSVELSHGICDDCYAEIDEYGELY